jgi:hypothetical protein
MMYILYVLLGLIAAAVLFRSLSFASKHRNQLTAAEVADTIEKHIQGAEGPWDWDDFTSIPIADDYLDKIRLRCLQLDYELPEERIQELSRIVERLRKPTG